MVTHMGVFEKIGKVAEDLAKGAQEALANIMVGTHNVVRGVSGIVDIKMLEQRRAKERAQRKLEYRKESKFLQASKYYFIGAIGKQEYGPEELRGRPSDKKLEEKEEHDADQGTLSGHGRR